jgi:hypothetical protein
MFLPPSRLGLTRKGELSVFLQSDLVAIGDRF